MRADATVLALVVDEEVELDDCRIGHGKKHAMGDDVVPQFGLQVDRGSDGIANPLDAGVVVNGGKSLDSSLGLVGIVHPRQYVEIGITAGRNSDDFPFLIECRTGP